MRSGVVIACAVLLHGTEFLLAQAPAREPTAAISGVVVDGTTGRPVAGALVSLYGPRSGQDPDGLRSRVTDELGRFVFTQLPAFDDYRLGVSRNGYLRFAGLGREGPVENPYAPEQRLSLNDGQWVRDLRLSLWRPGSIGGRVVDEMGETMVDVPVRVLGFVSIAGTRHLAGGSIARTDDRGMYRIGGLEPGQYIVSVPSVQATIPATVSGATLAGPTTTRPVTTDLIRLDVDAMHRLVANRYATPPPAADGRAQAYPPLYYPASTTIESATPVELSVGQQLRGIDIRLAPVAAVRVSGFIDAPPEAHAASLTLRLMAPGAESLGAGGETATAFAAPDGSFTFLNVPAGRYTILASRSHSQYTLGSGYQSSSLQGRTLPNWPGITAGAASPRGGGGGSSTSSVVRSADRVVRLAGAEGPGPFGFHGRLEVTVGDRDIDGLVVGLRRGTSIAGTITWDGTPAPGDNTSLYAEAANGKPWLGLRRGSMSRSSGSPFEVGGLLSGEYVLSFPAMVRSIEWQGRDYTDRSFDTSHGDITDVRVTFTAQAARLTGSVRVEGGGGAEAAAVLVFPTDPTLWRGYGLSPRRIAADVVSTAGTYRFPSLPAGEYFVIAVNSRQADGWKDPAFLERASALATRVTVGWGETRTTDLVVRQVAR